MGAWFIFMIKSVFCLTTLFLFYKVLLSKETFHTLNRYLLLAILTLALLLPLFKVPTAETRPIQLAFQTLEFAVIAQHDKPVDGYLLPEVTVSAEAEKGFTMQLFITLCLAIYLTGATVRTLFLARCFFILKRSIRRARKVQYGKYTIAIVPGKVSPYSWWHYIILSEDDYNETNGEILAHELAHLSRHHSTDILLCELFIIFQWFNPAVYLLKQELQSIHEYEADMAVIQKGFNATQYQLLLIKKAVGSSSYTLANSLNHSSLKKRITMMLRKRSNRWASLKAFGFLPLAALMLSAFARPEVSAKTEALTGMTSTENVSDKDTILRREEAIGGITIVEKANTTIPTKNGAKKGTAQADNKTTVVVKNATKDEEKPAGVQIRATSGDPGAAYTIRIRDNAVLSNANDPLIVIDGVPSDLDLNGANINDLSSSHSPLKDVNPADIKSIEILKDSSATTIYGEKGKNGVVLITTKKGQKGSSNNQEPFAYAKVEIPPVFPGGDMELMGWISKNVLYPEGAKARGEAGRVTVSFIINKDGKVVNGQVERGVSTELDQEALRVVSIMPNFTPGKHKGAPVDVRYVLPITFKLSK